jgi:hypothetical protein
MSSVISPICRRVFDTPKLVAEFPPRLCAGGEFSRSTGAILDTAHDEGKAPSKRVVPSLILTGIASTLRVAPHAVIARHIVQLHGHCVNSLVGAVGENKKLVGWEEPLLHAFPEPVEIPEGWVNGTIHDLACQGLSLLLST